MKFSEVTGAATPSPKASTEIAWNPLRIKATSCCHVANVCHDKPKMEVNDLYLKTLCGTKNLSEKFLKFLGILSTLFLYY